MTEERIKLDALPDLISELQLILTDPLTTRVCVTSMKKDVANQTCIWLVEINKVFKCSLENVEVK